jgi:hypothetical protein
MFEITHFVNAFHMLTCQSVAIIHVWKKQHLDTMKALSGGDDVAKNVFIATAAQKNYK